MLQALPHFADSNLFNEKEKLALEFTEMMATNHLAIGDEMMNKLKQRYSEPEIMAIGWRAAIFIGYGRLVYATGLESVGAVCEVNFAAG